MSPSRFPDMIGNARAACRHGTGSRQSGVSLAPQTSWSLACDFGGCQYSAGTAVGRSCDLVGTGPGAEPANREPVDACAAAKRASKTLMKHWGTAAAVWAE